MERRRFIGGLGASLVALGLGSAQGGAGLVRAVVLSGAEVVPNPANTPALAVVRLELMGSTLSLQGAVANLAGPFRDYTRDPVDDPALNARLTSAVHIHRGAKRQNGPLLQALKVTSAPDGRSATFADRLELSLDDLNRLYRGELYFDIHTAAFRAGELRGQILVM
ncbi:CHRD domain protein [Meiothermus luteus]|uniref:CHRD domain protein n=1 Tax=Meiothermus luteus TaxID=2026184 RepID=A0A399EG39_9DEIN|nr:CHRD domain-containing protein [Meiothermus luteus]RIH83634.1 CHRD domain protein [Meiothermus luteus]